MVSAKRLVLLAFVAFAFIVGSSEGANTAPKAHHLVYRVAPGKAVEVTLVGHDMDGDKLHMTVTTLPHVGNLYDLTQVYAQHNHPPMHLESTKISSANHLVPALSKNRIIYEAPLRNFSPGMITEFKYSVSDGLATSVQGRVVIIADSTSAEHVLVSSDFRQDNEGWLIVNNGKLPHEPVHEKSSYGVLNHFIFATDELLDIDQNGVDRKQWMFSAPAKFLGFQSWSYDGFLSVSIGAFSGDIKKMQTAEDNFAILECKTCAMGKGMRFAYKVGDISFNGTPTRISLHLSETGNWLKLSKNPLASPSVPTKCEFIEMLNDLSAVYILGDFTAWYETIGIDDVQFISKSTGKDHRLPPQCLT